jgi:hypothetical protein
MARWWTEESGLDKVTFWRPDIRRMNRSVGLGAVIFRQAKGGSARKEVNQFTVRTLKLIALVPKRTDGRPQRVQLSSVDKLPHLTSYCSRKKHLSTQRDGLSFCGEAKALAVHAVCRCVTLCWSAGLLVSFSPLFGLGSMDVNVLMRAANTRCSYWYDTVYRPRYHRNVSVVG